jgi:hypothetical protein
VTTRFDNCFAELKREGRAAFVTFVMCGDPDIETSLEIVNALPGSGADIIELGMPFTDPMADGPSIQAAGLRALKAGTTLKKTLDVVRRFRESNDKTPIILMGYYNPIYIHGVDKFLSDAKAAGVDGLILVDMPPEEDEELCIPALKAGLNFIRLATPTTSACRRCSRTRRGSSTMSPSPASPAAPRRILRKSRRPWPGSSATQSFRCASALASAPPSRRARSRPMPMAPWSAPRWSMPSAPASMRTTARRQAPSRRWPTRRPQLPQACGRPGRLPSSDSQVES